MLQTILRRSDLEQVLKLGRSAIYERLANDPAFPKPVRLGEVRAVGWIEKRSHRLAAEAHSGARQARRAQAEPRRPPPARLSLTSLLSFVPPGDRRAVSGVRETARRR
jgi:predicted DNA-binding transcriptional regulator AlpA